MHMEYIILGVAGVGIIFVGFALTVLFKPGQPKEEDNVAGPDNTVLTTLNDDLTQVKTDLGKMASAYQSIETEVLLAKKLASDTQAELSAIRKEISQALTPILADKEELKKKIQALEEEVKKSQGNKGVGSEEVGEIKKKIQAQEEDNKKLVENIKKIEEGMKKIQESASASPQDGLNEIKVQIRAKDEELKKLQQGQEAFGKEIEALKQSAQKQVAPAPAGVDPEALKQVQEAVKKDIDGFRQALQAKEQALAEVQKTIAAIGKDIEALRSKIEAQAKEAPAPAVAPPGVTKEDLDGLKKRMENAEQVLRVLSGGG